MAGDAALNSRAGKSFDHTPIALVAVSPARLADSAAVGSRGARLMRLDITASDTAAVSWTASLARNSGWLDLDHRAGTTPAER